MPSRNARRRWKISSIYNGIELLDIIAKFMWLFVTPNQTLIWQSDTSLWMCHTAIRTILLLSMFIIRGTVNGQWFTLMFQRKKYMHKNTWETYPYAAHMRLVKYACSLKSNHERVQLEEPVYTKVTLRLVSRLAWSMQPRSAFWLCQRAKPSLTPWYRYCYWQFSKPNHGLSSCWSLPKQS